jgi:hypothetical protein
MLLFLPFWRWAKKMNSNLNNERRKEAQRRHSDGGPPQGLYDRRVNIERRLFNLDAGCIEEWLSKPATNTGANSKPSGK